ncbi:hypothetical protein PUN28_002761 [Cardiocondyla obscurior]|uniref:Uncharacterized protein n=1 Tax=Cardiocondyla obscurior TaxID=286306 RepID=A0AAW2GVX2_9HYME
MQDLLSSKKSLMLGNKVIRGIVYIYVYIHTYIFFSCDKSRNAQNFICHFCENEGEAKITAALLKLRFQPHSGELCDKKKRGTDRKERKTEK